LQGCLEDIWETKQLTNGAKYHRLFESELAEFLKVKHVSLFANGTLALVSALQTLRVTGEVITTPFSFVATPHALHWTGIRPVFCDIDPVAYNLDPEKIEAAITPKTTAILPVHVYGNPCDVNRIQDIADSYGLRLIYDACHAFGVTVGGTSILNFGDLSVLSFHATKVFTTFEGGAIVCHDEKMKKRIDFLKNFGFADETVVVGPGINAKMNEFQAALGLLHLKYFARNTALRSEHAAAYRKNLEGIAGIKLLAEFPDVEPTYQYFPVFVDEGAYGKSRDALYGELKKHNIFTRRYFYPLISQFPTYKGLPSAVPGSMPCAERVTKEVLCLPLYADMRTETIETISSIVRGLARP
jgi:dTDP-4-amino-4,6-dideoxygalactose transaminase